LINEARQAGAIVLPELSEFESGILGTSSLGTRTSAESLVAFTVRDASNAQQRAAALVRLLAESSGAAAAHLFMVQADGSVTWAASHAEQLHDDSHLLHARRCLQQALSDDGGATAIESELSTAASDSSAVWTDSSGVPQRALLLTAAAGGEPPHVAVVILTALASRPQSHHLLAAVSEHLVALGDTEGLVLQ
jgi:hypothetical protein